jgi:hypothetical protein
MVARNCASLMVGDYVATAYSGGKAFAIFGAAQANSVTLFDELIYTTTSELTAAQQAAVLTSATERPVPNAHSEPPRRQFYDQEHRHPIPND